MSASAQWHIASLMLRFHAVAGSNGAQFVRNRMSDPKIEVRVLVRSSVVSN